MAHCPSRPPPLRYSLRADTEYGELERAQTVGRVQLVCSARRGGAGRGCRVKGMQGVGAKGPRDAEKG